MAADLTPIDTGSMETCPTNMADKLKDLIPIIEKALRDADGEAPYATYKFEDVKSALGSKTETPYGFAACINRLIGDYYSNKTDIAAHAAGGNILFNRVKSMKRVVTD